MADIFTPEKRSEIQSRIRSSGTKPEDVLYAAIRSILGPRWRIDRNVTELPGQPDILIPSLRLVIFADGCFYHCCPKHGRRPKTNGRYWWPKLKRNVLRDAANRRRLRALGYSVWRFWEHDLKGRAMARTYCRLERRLQKRAANARVRVRVRKESRAVKRGRTRGRVQRRSSARRSSARRSSGKRRP